VVKSRQAFPLQSWEAPEIPQLATHLLSWEDLEIPHPEQDPVQADFRQSHPGLTLLHGLAADSRQPATVRCYLL
jgi:hypothetical protein